MALLVGCTKENRVQNEQASNAPDYILNFVDGNPVWEAIPQAAGESNIGAFAADRTNSLHAHGDFHMAGGTISFSGTQNNGGAHGQAEIQIPNLHILLETARVVSMLENEVVYGGIVTEVIENNMPQPPPRPGSPPPACTRWDLGTYVYFAVKDNGQGNNAPPDQVKLFIFPFCVAIPDPSLVAVFSRGNWADLTDESDMIKVND